MVSLMAGVEVPGGPTGHGIIPDYLKHRNPVINIPGNVSTVFIPGKQEVPGYSQRRRVGGRWIARELELLEANFRKTKERPSLG